MDPEVARRRREEILKKRASRESAIITSESADPSAAKVIKKLEPPKQNLPYTPTRFHKYLRYLKYIPHIFCVFLGAYAPSFGFLYIVLAEITFDVLVPFLASGMHGSKSIELLSILVPWSLSLKAKYSSLLLITISSRVIFSNLNKLAKF